MPYQEHLDRGVALLDDRQYAKALAELAEASRLDPTRGEPEAHRAVASLRTEHYDEALSACAAALAKTPHLHWVLPTCWAAKLEQDGWSEEGREAVRREIEALLQSSPREPRSLLAALEGFGYLEDEAKQVEVATRLANSAPGTERAAQAASALFDETLRAKDPGARALLAETYLRSFPDERSAFDAARIWLRLSELEPPARPSDPWEVAHSLFEGDENHRRRNAGVASWMIEKGRSPQDSVRLLERSLTLLDQEGLSARPPLFTAEAWAAQINADRALYRYLLGRALLQVGNTRRAQRELAAALGDETVAGGAHQTLGQLALDQGRLDEAIRHLRAALEISGRPKESLERLAKALLEHSGWTAEPRYYFLEREGGPWFEDVTAAAGLQGIAAERVAWGDIDGDGREDLLLDGTRLLANRPDGTFEDVTAASGLPSPGSGEGGLWADVDNDGDLDLLVTSRAGNHLWYNTGRGRFTDATDVALGASLPRQTEAAAWGDIDNDGDLDLYLVNYERPGPILARCLQDQLLRNNGKGTFSDWSQQAGILSEEPLCGRGVTWTDFDADGWQDVAVGNYRLDPNFLWRNRGAGTFEDVAADRGFRGRGVEGSFGHTIGVVAGDLNGDGNVDLYVSNLAHPRYIEHSNRSMLLVSSGPPAYRFVDRFEGSGIGFEETSADPALADVDGDGDLDLYVTSTYAGRFSHLYLNRGDGRFTDRSWLTGTRAENAWGAAFADYDNDGSPDLLVASSGGVRLFRNRSQGRWLAVRIDDHRCNRNGVGARVTMRYGNRVLLREVTAGRGTGSQDSLTLFFGLADHAGVVDVEARTLCGDLLRERVDAGTRSLVLHNPPS